ncbi:hypothetical protein R3P38DRAFT_2899297 [Favolaschia claudopus]|uniref:RING-type domain-containing protein n=1 Tax=Favolaschia claudopus TaxID=2862362 RepID=A0AAW0CK61_9AGAR
MSLATMSTDTASTCRICSSPYVSPVSLPCGHIFCRECIRKSFSVSDPAKPCQLQQNCAICRAPYSALIVNPELVPVHLRPHILPQIRRVFLNEINPPPASASVSASTSSSTSNQPTLVPTPSPQAANLACAQAEINALQTQCAMWRKRAETHAMGNSTLLAFTRAAKDCAIRLRAERDAERSKCVILKRKLAELLAGVDPDEESPFSKRPCLGAVAKTAGACLPVFLMQCKRTAAFLDAKESLLGPPISRRCAKTELPARRNPDPCLAFAASLAAASPPSDESSSSPSPTLVSSEEEGC